MRLACTTRPFFDLPLDAACAAIARIGFDDVALFTVRHPDQSSRVALSARSSVSERQAIASALNNNGLSCSLLLAHLPEAPSHARAADDYRQLIDHAAALGIPSLLDLGCDDAGELPAYRQLLHTVLPHAHAAGVRLLLKPHGGMLGRSSDLLALAAELASPAFALAADPGNTLYYSHFADDPVKELQQLAGRCHAVFVKDCQLKDGAPDVLLNPGEGRVDWPAIMAELGRQRFARTLYLECVAGDDAATRSDNVALIRKRVLEWMAH